MSLKPFSSFASGELAPVLHDNVTLEKFNKGLATARNVVVSKTGSIISRFSTFGYTTAKNVNEKIKLYVPPNSNYLMEWGNLYLRVHFIEDLYQVPSFTEYTHAFTEADLEDMHFANNGDFVYAFVGGKEMAKFKLPNIGFIGSVEKFEIPNAPQTNNVNVNSSTGYQVDYLASIVVNGEESYPTEMIDPGILKPINATESNTVQATWEDESGLNRTPSFMRVYSRPSEGGAYGFLGSSSAFVESVPGEFTFSYEDLGNVPDYTNGFQRLLTEDQLNSVAIEDLNPRTGTVYQQRLIVTTDTDKEALIASRPGYQNNFFRDVPYDPDSALQFKAGTSGKANVLRLVDSDGLISFTTNGVYVSVGQLDINNTAMSRRGPWIINDKLPPLVIPGGVFFVDNCNVIRQLVFSQEVLTYQTQEQTIFSNHLFANRTIQSWAYQSGVVGVIIVTFSDGKFATFTYSDEHLMRAWTRHDHPWFVEQVEGTGLPDRTFFVINKNGTRYVDVSLPRIVPAADRVEDTEWAISTPTAFMDSIRTRFFYINSYGGMDKDGVGGTDYLKFIPVIADQWDGELRLLTNGGTNIFIGATPNTKFYRWINPIDGTRIDFDIISYVSDSEIIVQPSEEYPSEYASRFVLYEVQRTITGLSRFNDEYVSVMVDGSVLASPNNDQDEHDLYLVTGGSITIPEDQAGAITHVGRPITADVKTLNVSTIEQGPTLIESINVNKMYLRVYETRGLYIGNTFPEEANGSVDGSSVINMEDLYEIEVPVGSSPLLGNTYDKPISKRIEVMMKGEWKNQGQISLRQVDPVHFEIMSIIADYEVQRR